MMYPQAELENYKLQVELLQEKLQRSEENRQNLEHKLDNVLQKRHDLDKKLRSKTRQRYQEFLDEQQKRNERNKTLLAILERVDQQTTALSVRSERLKMMKLQYEMYFAKLVQNQTMRCIQQAATPPVATTTAPYVLVSTTTGAPVVGGADGITLPASALAQANVIAIKSNECTAVPSMSSAVLNTTGKPLQPYAETLTPAMGIMGGMVTYGPTPQIVTQPPRMFAMSQGDVRNAYENAPAAPMTNLSHCVMPTSATSTTTASPNATTRAFEQFGDYNDLLPMNRNIGNITRNSSSSNIDEMPTLRALENDYNRRDDYYGVGPDGAAVARRRLPGPLLTPSRLYQREDYLHATENDNEHFGMLSTAGESAQQANEQLHGGRTRRHDDNEELSKTASRRPLTIAETTTAMTFDKLPKMTMTRNNLQKYDDDGDDDATRYADKAGDDFHRYNGGEVVGGPTDTQFGRGVDADKEFALPNPRTANGAAFGAVSTANIPAGEQAARDGDVNRRQKIDEAWQSAATTTTTTMPSSASGAFNEDELPMFTADLARIKDHEPGNASNTTTTKAMTTTTSSLGVTENGVATGGFTDDVAHTTMARPGNELSTEGSARIDDSNDVKATPQHLSQSETVEPTQSQSQPSAQKSFENIENAIYGELVNPPEPQMDQQRQPGLLEGLVTVQPTQTLSPQANEQSTSKEQQPLMDVPTSSGYANYPYDGGQSEPVETDATTTSLSSTSYNQEEPSYATIGGTTNAEVYEPPPGDTSYSSNTTSAVEYPQNNDERQTVESERLNAENPQDYSNVDYGQYDPNAQYDPNTYDPNAYPGYTYDETTGQYTADPVNEYATDPAYSSQGYDAQQYDPNQQNPTNYDYSQYGQAETEGTMAEAYESQQVQPEADLQPLAADMDSQAPVTDVAQVSDMSKEEPAADEVPQPKVIKPTSILSTAAEKQAADKKKKRVNFVESSDTDESAALKGTAAAVPTSSESDFEFSSSGEAVAKSS